MNKPSQKIRRRPSGIAIVSYAIVVAAIVGTIRMTIRPLSAAPLGTIVRATSTPTAGAYSNPVIDSNFPDPCILNDGNAYYAYATNSGPNMPARWSTDLTHWSPLPDAMPTLPAWAKPGRTWAPDVIAIKHSKKYVAYFAAWDRQTDKQAVGAAFSTSPAGPFVATDAPLVEQPEIGGAIDPSCFVTSKGDRYLLWKNDGNSMKLDTWIWIQKLSVDGLSLVGDPIKLIKQDQSWEWVLIEAPTLWEHDGKFYLFYSANYYGNCNYAVGYAVAPSLFGPYQKSANNPWLSQSNDGCGPGGEDIVRASDGSTWMSYHTWVKGPGSYRGMSIKRLDWDGDVPVLR